MDYNRKMAIEAEMANYIIDACGKTGILESVNSNKLTGSIKTLYNNAMKDCAQFKDKNDHVDPNIQAIFARIYGLI